jgi:hypothetical protein
VVLVFARTGCKSRILTYKIPWLFYIFDPVLQRGYRIETSSTQHILPFIILLIDHDNTHLSKDVVDLPQSFQNDDYAVEMLLLPVHIDDFYTIFYESRVSVFRAL